MTARLQAAQDLTDGGRQSAGGDDGHEPADKQGRNVRAEREGDVAEDADGGEDHEALPAADNVGKHPAQGAETDGHGHVHSSCKRKRRSVKQVMIFRKPVQREATFCR